MANSASARAALSAALAAAAGAATAAFTRLLSSCSASVSSNRGRAAGSTVKHRCARSRSSGEETLGHVLQLDASGPGVYRVSLGPMDAAQQKLSRGSDLRAASTAAGDAAGAPSALQRAPTLDQVLGRDDDDTQSERSERSESVGGGGAAAPRQPFSTPQVTRCLERKAATSLALYPLRLGRPSSA